MSNRNERLQDELVQAADESYDDGCNIVIICISRTVHIYIDRVRASSIKGLFKFQAKNCFACARSHAMKDPSDFVALHTWGGGDCHSWFSNKGGES